MPRWRRWRSAPVLMWVGMAAEVGAARSCAWIGNSSGPPTERSIQSDQRRLLLLVIHPARPSLAEVPVAHLSSHESLRRANAWVGGVP